MRLLEAIIDANHRAVAGDPNVGLHPAEFADSLPLVALTCLDPRLNQLFPQALGVPSDQFIWVRNAGNVITGPLSSTVRSVALACAVKHGKEIVIIGHTRCEIIGATTSRLIDIFAAMGVPRRMLPENLAEFFGMSGSERQNILKACEFLRGSPLIPSCIPVHGLLADTETGKLEWLVNGYENSQSTTAQPNPVLGAAAEAFDALKGLAEFKIEEMKWPETKIGEVVTKAGEWLAGQT
ncbi:MAG TPA: carbonic anhydrase, partial [Verrucomicrobiae bacterium]|nr:carbonic anhydrase [Verrucomicrobiae bacterium]